MGKIYTFVFNSNNIYKQWSGSDRAFTYATDFSFLPNKLFKVKWSLYSTNNGSIANNDIVYTWGCDLPVINSIETGSSLSTQGNFLYSIGIAGFQTRSTSSTATTRYLNVNANDNPYFLCRKPQNTLMRFGITGPSQIDSGIGGGGILATNQILVMYFEEVDE